MQMYQLIYCSTATKEMSWQDVSNLANSSSHRNATNEIYGLLVYGNGYFVQILEGSQERINALYLKIATDSRHYDQRLLHYAQIAHPSFKEWNMGCLLVNEQQEVKNIIERYFNEAFIPSQLSPEQSNLFMHEMGVYFKS